MNRMRLFHRPSSLSISLGTRVSQFFNPRFITPSYCSIDTCRQETDPFLSCIEQALFKILPEELVQELTTARSPSIIRSKMVEIDLLLPLLRLDLPQIAPCTLNVIALFPAEFTGGIGRYFSDTLSHWLVPGKFINISASQSINFHFKAYPEQNYFLVQEFLDIHRKEDIKIIENTWEALRDEIRLNTLAVKHARNIISVKKLSSDQKKALIQENIASVIDRPTKAIDTNAFDHMHHLLLQVAAEDRLNKIKEQFLPSFEQRPKAFQRDIFNELKHFILLFGEKFTKSHTLHYVSRLISYQYLFRKSLEQIISSTPGMRHLSIKLIKNQLNRPHMQSNSRSVLGIFGAMNLQENEVFEERHLFQAICQCLCNVNKVEHSFILDQRPHDPIRIFYIEIEKKEEHIFHRKEINHLQKNLPREIKECIESVIHPVFMPRNDEEIMRNILLLSQQLKYLSDLPQVIISFESQIQNDLIFRVILLRLLKDNTPTIKEMISASSELTIRDLEIKHVGVVRKKYIREANVFKVHLNKKKFLRKNFSIDLFKARQILSSELNKIFKGIRDFNGGILSKQQEAFIALKNLFKDISEYKNFLLENFFHSISPSLHQNLKRSYILKELFMMTLEALETERRSTAIFFKTHTIDDQLLMIIASSSTRLQDFLFSDINSMRISSSDLTATHIFSDDIHCFGYIYQQCCPIARNVFSLKIQENILSVMQKN